MEKSEPRWLEVLKVTMPLCLSYIPIGIASGILLQAAGFNMIMIILVSLLVFSGGAQFMIASMLTANAPMQTILLMLFFLELRYALLGSSLSQFLQNTSKKFIYFFAISLNDENYAINYLKFSTDKSWTGKDGLMVEHYSLASWTIANFIGSFVGGFIHINLEIVDFALTALFLYMIMMQIKNRLKIIVSLCSAVLAVIFMHLMKSTMGLVVATLIASLIGFFIEDRLRKSGKANSILLRRIKGRRKLVKSGSKE